MIIYSHGEHPKKKEDDLMDAQNKTITRTEYTDLTTGVWEFCKKEGLPDEEAMKFVSMTVEQMATDGWRIVEG
jgi:hypothetical protein